MKLQILKYTALLTLTVLLNCSTGGQSSSVLSKTFKGTRMLSEGVNRIYIDNISDGSINSVVKEAFESSLKSKINLNKKLSVVNSVQESDLILKILLTGFSSEPVKFNSSGIAEEKKLRVDSYVWLITSSTGEEKVKRKKVESVQFYSDIKPPIISEYKAITALTDLLAERIVSVIITGWYPESI